MGCGPSKGSTATIPANVGNGNATQEKTIENEVIPPPIAFVVPLDENTENPPTLEEGLPPPPPRIQKLLEEVPKEPPSPSRIEKRLASAERRRQQILQQRAGSTMSGRARTHSIGSPPGSTGDDVSLNEADRENGEEHNATEEHT